MKPTFWSIAIRALLGVVPVLTFAHSYGPPVRVTAAPGDGATACTACHTGTALNAGGGKVEILLASGNTYSPGVKQRITVRVSDPAQRRWGFELTARLNNDPSNGQAGDLAPSDDNTQVVCDDGNPKPCASAKVVQFIMHSLSGTHNGTTGGFSFDFDWTPPATDSGPITLYAAGNAANGNGSPTGDHIYTTSVQLTPFASAGVPTIASNGIFNAAGFQQVIAPATWVTLKGADLAGNTRLWSGSDIRAGVLPTALDGTSVTINGKPAYVEYISPVQVNVLTPDDSSTGPVQVTITGPNGTSSAFTAQMQSLAPAFFQFDTQYLAAEHADGSYVGKTGLFPSAPSITTPAKPGEVIVLYATSFGPTTPAQTTGKLATSNARLTTAAQVTIGGTPANVQFAGLIAGYAGLYQINVEVPATVGDGDQKVVAQVGSVFTPSSSTCCFITIQH